eukprot:TRINITY_DN74717_c0_g1_i1.p1 TRINITY_DN74717_c0_g1~~TRINITY_DN74717_c0_g1_i1.p1  ORF type:complete len:380 (-),score=51.73 TRINITY_DN74717_c0_g1_i1:220-1359(-)
MAGSLQQLAAASRTSIPRSTGGGVVAKLGKTLCRPVLYWVFHSTRLFGYFFWLPLLLAVKPYRTLLGLFAYAVVHRKLWWQKIIHRAMGYGASRRHRMVNNVKHLIRDDKRYLWCSHPHGVLADGWHSIIAANVDSFAADGNGPTDIHRKTKLCFAPIIQHVPVHQEMYRELCGAADKKSVMDCWKTDADPVLIPGGFAESVFASAGTKDVEYSYIKDRRGFIRICIEAGKDIVPMYGFRTSRMYHNPSILRGWRAQFSQHYFIAMVLPMGWLGTAMPLTDKTTTVIFPPFEASRYSLSQIGEAHEAYMAHLKHHFDANKAAYGMRDVKLEFIGNDFVDDDVIARGLRRLGVLKQRKAKAKGPVPLQNGEQSKPILAKL